MPRDPICGHYVEKSTPYKQEQDGEIYYFCCLDCMEEFEYGSETSKTVDEEPIDLKEK